MACSSHLSLQVVQVLALSKNELHRCTFCAFATLKIEVGDFKRWWSSHKNVWKKWKRKSKGSKQCWKCIFSTEMQSMLKLWGFFWQRWKSIRHVTPWSTLFKCMHKHISLIILKLSKTSKVSFSLFKLVYSCLNLLNFVLVQTFLLWLNLFNYIQACLILFKLVYSCLNLFNFVQVCYSCPNFSTFNFVQACLILFNLVYSCLILSTFVQTCLFLFDFVQTCLFLFNFVQACLFLFIIFYTCSISKIFWAKEELLKFLFDDQFPSLDPDMIWSWIFERHLGWGFSSSHLEWLSPIFSEEVFEKYAKVKSSFPLIKINLSPLENRIGFAESHQRFWSDVSLEK